MVELTRKLANALEYFYKAENGDARAYHLNSCKKLLVSVLHKLKGSVPVNVTEEINMAIRHVDYFSSNPNKYFNSPKYFYKHVGSFIGCIYKL